MSKTISLKYMVDGEFDAKSFLMDEIGFLQWAELDNAFLEKHSYEQPRTIISPDAHSLHLVWQWPDGDIQHEIADYPYVDTYNEFLEWLGEEVADDAYGDVEWAKSIEDFIAHDGFGKFKGIFNPLDFKARG